MINNLVDPIKAAVVVPAYNAAATLAACLNGLIVQRTFGRLELAIIVVDDGSSDATARIAAEYADCAVTLVRTPHRGAAAARNAGVKAAPSGYSIILFTDADCVPAPDWAWQMVTALQASPATTAGVKGIYRTKQKEAVARFVQAEYDERYRRFATLGKLPEFADTYAAAYRREVLTAFPFDEQLPGAIVEDAELGWRIRRAGYSFGFAPAAIVYHRHAATIGAYFRRKFQIGRWRLKIYRAYPDKLSNDAHTAQSAKLQMLLFAGMVGAVATSQWANVPGLKSCVPSQKILTLIKRGGLVGALGFGLSLQISYLPFLRRLWTEQQLAAPAAWLMLNVRTAAYTTGASVGLAELLFSPKPIIN